MIKSRKDQKLKKLDKKVDPNDPSTIKSAEDLEVALSKVKICVDKENKKKGKERAKNLKNSSAKALRAAFMKDKVWPSNSIINIAFLEEPDEDFMDRTSINKMRKYVDNNGVALEIDPLQETIDNFGIKEAVIKTVMERLQPIVNVKFNFYDKDNKLLSPAKADIKISFDPNGGAWSLLGLDCLNYPDPNFATMNLGWFDVPTTLHEFCHALGMVHEHQNPFGVKINWAVDRVLSWAKKTQGWDEKTTKENIINKYSVDQINGSNFDGKSIMLYFFDAILVNDESGKCCGKGTNQNLIFSPLDVLFLNKNYPHKNMLPDQFTVKFFNDTFNKQIDISILQKELSESDIREKDSSFTTSGRQSNALSSPVQSMAKKEGYSTENIEDKQHMMKNTPLEPFETCEPCEGFNSWKNPYLITLIVLGAVFLIILIVLLIMKKFGF
jgi:hypothetical protein